MSARAPLLWSLAGLLAAFGLAACASDRADTKLFLDVHHLDPAKVTVAGVAEAHQKDLATVAQEMRVLSRKARRTDPDELYRKAAACKPADAMERLDVEQAKAELE